MTKRISRELRDINNEPTFINTSPWFQREYKPWNDKRRTRFIEVLLMGRTINPIWVIEISDEFDGVTFAEHMVVDGQHRIRTCLDFIENKFALGSDMFHDNNKLAWRGKYYKDLSVTERNIFLRYQFHINIYDYTYNTPEKIQEIYETLNSSSTQLNAYEIIKPSLNNFYKFISKYEKDFMGTHLYKNTESKHGSIHSCIIDMFALTSKDIIHFISLPDLRTKYERNVVMQHEVDKFITEYSGDMDNMVKSYKRILSEMATLFDKYMLSERAYEKRLFVARITNKINQMSSDEHQIIPTMIKKCKSKFKVILDHKAPHEIFQLTGRTAAYKYKLIKYVDDILNEAAK